MSGLTSFDYAAMAEEVLAVTRQLEAGLERVRAERPHGIDETIRRYSRILTLEEELIEQRDKYNWLIARAKERDRK